jgi:hypothetical protein
MTKYRQEPTHTYVRVGEAMKQFVMILALDGNPFEVAKFNHFPRPLNITPTSNMITNEIAGPPRNQITLMVMPNVV